jgi:hypothetical protein
MADKIALLIALVVVAAFGIGGTAEISLRTSAERSRLERELTISKARTEFYQQLYTQEREKHSPLPRPGSPPRPGMPGSAPPIGAAGP